MSSVDYAVEVDVKELTDRVNVSADNWEEMIQQYDFNYFDKIEVFDILNLIGEIKNQLKNQLEHKNIELILETNTIVFLKTDREKMSLILRHILRNSIQYSHQDGKILIKVIEDHGYCNISIQDEGVGIDEALLPTLLPGNGAHLKSTEWNGTHTKNMGLSLCRDWIEDMGGVISIKSKLNNGTSVYISLPTMNNIGDKKS